MSNKCLTVIENIGQLESELESLKKQLEFKVRRTLKDEDAGDEYEGYVVIAYIRVSDFDLDPQLIFNKKEILTLNREETLELVNFISEHFSLRETVLIPCIKREFANVT